MLFTIITENTFSILWVVFSILNLCIFYASLKLICFIRKCCFEDLSFAHFTLFSFHFFFIIFFLMLLLTCFPNPDTVLMFRRIIIIVKYTYLTCQIAKSLDIMSRRPKIILNKGVNAHLLKKLSQKRNFECLVHQHIRVSVVRTLNVSQVTAMTWVGKNQLWS